MHDKIKKIRNIGIIAHIDAGKTTTSERILFYTESISRIGEVHEGAATMDFIPEEQEHGITINAAANTCYWCEHQINLIDTPGHVDFTIEVERSLRVLDAAIGVFCAVSGVEPQTETVWRQSEKFNLPKLATINKIDRSGADYAGVLEAMKQRLNITPLPMTVPLGEGDDFEYIVDILNLKRLDYDEHSLGKVVHSRDLTKTEYERVIKWREKFIEVLSEHDDTILGAYLLGEEFNKSYCLEVIRKLTLECKIVPVFATSALHNKGIQSLLDAVVLFLPSPEDQIMQALDDRGNSVYLLANKTQYFTGLAFKVFITKKEKLVFLRIYTGTLNKQQLCYNASSQKEEKIGSIYRVLADAYEEIEQACAGDIVAVSGLSQTQTGDSLCLKENIVLLEPITTYQPVLGVAIEAQNEDDLAKLDESLLQIIQEDPTLRFDKEHLNQNGQRLISGMGELHLEIVLEKIQREKNISLKINNPQVLYKETLQQSSELVEAIGCFDQIIEGTRHFAFITINIKPLVKANGNKINLNITTAFDVSKEQNINKDIVLTKLTNSDFSCFNKVEQNKLTEYFIIIENEVTSALKCGPLGYALEGVEVDVINVLFHSSYISETAIRMATNLAMRELFLNIKTVLLEPVMLINLSLPTNFVGNIVTLLATHNARLDRISDEECNMRKNITAFAFMKYLFGFSTALRSASQGRASLSMVFDRFDNIV